MSVDNGSMSWNRIDNVVSLGSQKISEIYMGNTKIYPLSYPFMGLREIVEDFAQHYGDPSGLKYNWYIRFPDPDVFRTFGKADRVLDVYVFCDWHAPHNGQYYERDKSKPVGFTNWDETRNLTIDGVEYKDVPVMRCIWFCAATAEKTEKYYSGLWDAYTVPVYPYWVQGHGSRNEYYVPGGGLIWFGWEWWIHPYMTCIFQYDFVKREFGPELRGSSLFYDPPEPDETGGD